MKRPSFAVLTLVALCSPILAKADALSHRAEEILCCVPEARATNYSEAVSLERRSGVQAAYADYACLAAKGDDRAQFKLAEYLARSAQREDLMVAGALATVSHAMMKNRKRLQLAEAIHGRLTDVERAASNELAKELAARGPHVRVDSPGTPESLQKRDERERKRFTGSRIEREDSSGMPLHTIP